MAGKRSKTAGRWPGPLAAGALWGLLFLITAPDGESQAPPGPAPREIPAEPGAAPALAANGLNRAALNLLRGQGHQENPDDWPAELRGWAWLRRHEYARALETWGEPAAGLAEPVKQRLKLAQARALLQMGAGAGRVEQALRPVLEAPGPGGLAKIQGRRLAAEARLREKQYREVLALIKAWPPAERGSPLGLRMSGAAREGLGQLEAALADYKKAREQSPPNLEKVRAAAEYRRLLKILAARDGGRFWVDLVNLHRREWRLEEARRMIDQAPAASLTAAQKNGLEAQKQLLAIYQGRYDEGCSYYLKAAGARRRRAYGRCLERAGRHREGAEVFEALARAGTSQSQQDEDLAEAVKLRALAGEFKAAAHLAETIASPRARAEAAWRQGLALALRGRWPESRAFFESLLKHPGAAPELVQGGRYFQARALEESGGEADRGRARLIFKELAGGPPNYYQILAGGRYYGAGRFQAAPALAALMAVGPEGHDSQSVGFQLWFRGLDPLIPADPLALADEFLAPPRAEKALPAEFQALAELLAAGLWPQALEEADYILARRPELTAANKARLARLIWGLSAQSGRYHQALRARNLLAQARPSRPGPAPAARFDLSGHPLVFSRPILDLYQTYHLPPQLILALIKTESAWRDDAVSPANAQGLMQLLPATAEKIAAALGEDAPDEAELSRPALNIRYGGWYLAALTEGFEGQWPLALAGYNGGPFNIALWLENQPGAPLDVFLETIPLVETRRYVKKVIEGAHLYELAYLGRGGFVDLARPAARANNRLPSF